MTASVLQASSPSLISRFFARLGLEITAFFEEHGKAVERAYREQPFGL